MDRVPFRGPGFLTSLALALAFPCFVLAEGTPEIFVPAGHSADIHTLAISPDGQTIASGSSDNTIKLWDVPRGTMLRTLIGHGGQVTAVTFSPDGSTLASSSRGKVMLWDTRQGQKLATLKDDFESVSAVAFTPDGRTLAFVSGKTIILWDRKKNKKRRTLSGHTKGIRTMALAPNGRFLASGSGSGNVILWDVKNGKALHSLHTHSRPVEALAFSPNSRSLASGSMGNPIVLHDVPKGTVQKKLSARNESAFSIVFSSDGRRLVSGGGKHIILWDVAKGTVLRKLKGHTSWVETVAFTPDGGTLVSGSLDNTIKLWNVAQGTVLRTLGGYANPVLSVAFSPDGRTIASGSREYEVTFWDSQQGKRLSRLGGPASLVGPIAFSPDGRTIASGSKEYTIAHWDVAQKKLIRRLGRPLFPLGLLGKVLGTGGHTNTLITVAFSPDGRSLASGGTDKKIILWDVENGKIRWTLEEPSAIHSLAFSHDGDTLASASDTLKLLDVKRGEVLRIVGGVRKGEGGTGLAFSPDRRTLAAGTGFGVTLWDVKQGKILRKLKGLSQSRTMSFTLSPDGRTLATGNLDHTISLWDVAKGTVRHTLRGHTDRKLSLAFAPDSQTLVSGSRDGTIKLWDVKTGTLVLNYISLPSNEWLVFAPHNLMYNSSPQGDDYAAVRFDNQDRSIYPLSRYRPQLRRADLSQVSHRPRPRIVRPSRSAPQQGTVGDLANIKNHEKGAYGDYPSKKILALVRKGDEKGIQTLFRSLEPGLEKMHVASTLLSLRIKDAEYFQYLAELARGSIESDMPWPSKFDERGKFVRGEMSAAFVAWCETQKVDPKRTAVKAGVAMTPVLMLAKSGDTRAAPLFLQGLTSPNYSVAGMSARGLGMIGDPQGITPIIQAALKAPMDARIFISPELAYFDDPKAKKMLQQLVPDPEKRQAYIETAQRAKTGLKTFQGKYSNQVQ